MSDYRENAEVVRRFLDDDDWCYGTKELDDGVLFYGSVGGFKGLYQNFNFRLLVQSGSAQCFALFPASDLEKTAEISEFIVRANHGLLYGAFDLDASDGEISFHMALPFEAIDADSDWIPALISIPVKMLCRYSKGFTAVMMGLKSPEEAVADCESAKEDDDE